MYEIKHQPEDFVVEEQSIHPKHEPGEFSYWQLKKKNLTTLEACQIIADYLKVPQNYIGCAGNKDKKAITTQLISIRIGNNQNQIEKLKRLNHQNITLTYLGTGKKHIYLGDLQGNKFTIVVRNLKTKPQLTTTIPNLFGPQRFSEHNIEIGKALVKKNFAEAAKLIDHQKTQEQLTRDPQNALTALQKTPKKLLKLYIHAYQSHLFNEIIKQYLKWGILNQNKNQTIPLIGFGMEEIKDQKLNRIFQKIMEQEEITPRDFIIRELPEISAEGDERALFMDIKDLNISELGDDKFSANKKCTLNFTLGKGSYATVVIDFLFKQAPLVPKGPTTMCP